MLVGPFCFSGPVVTYGTVKPMSFYLPTGSGVGGRRRPQAAPPWAVRRLLAGTAFPASVLAAEGMGRERKARGFYFGDSGHGKQRLAMAAAAAMAMASRSSWGALLGQREGLPRVGAGRGRCGGAHLERNRTKMA